MLVATPAMLTPVRQMLNAAIAGLVRDQYGQRRAKHGGDQEVNRKVRNKIVKVGISRLNLRGGRSGTRSPAVSRAAAGTSTPVTATTAACSSTWLPGDRPAAIGSPSIRTAPPSASRSTWPTGSTPSEASAPGAAAPIPQALDLAAAHVTGSQHRATAPSAGRLPGEVVAFGPVGRRAVRRRAGLRSPGHRFASRRPGSVWRCPCVPGSLAASRSAGTASGSRYRRRPESDPQNEARRLTAC